MHDGVLHIDGGGCLDVDGPDGPATYIVRPEALDLDDDGTLRARVAEATYAGTFVRVVLRHADHRLEAHVATGTRVAVGDDVGLRAARIWRLPRELPVRAAS